MAELGCAGDVGIGLSGVVYAYFGFLLVSRRHHVDFEGILPARTIRLMLGWLGLCFVLTYAEILPIANFAHLGGLVIGCVVGVAVYGDAWRRRARVGVALLGVLSFQPLLWCPWHEDWLLAQAYRALVAADDDRALAMMEKVRAKNPSHAWTLQNEAWLRLKRGEYAVARDNLTMLARDSKDPRVLNSLAWLLATCRDVEIRDGARAVDLARRACESDGWKQAAYIDTLAAAYAEAGDYTAAEKWMLKALENPGDSKAVLQEHLECFRAGKPWREGAPASGAAAPR